MSSTDNFYVDPYGFCRAPFFLSTLLISFILSFCMPTSAAANAEFSNREARDVIQMVSTVILTREMESRCSNSSAFRSPIQKKLNEWRNKHHAAELLVAAEKLASEQSYFQDALKRIRLITSSTAKKLSDAKNCQALNKLLERKDSNLSVEFRDAHAKLLGYNGGNKPIAPKTGNAENPPERLQNAAADTTRLKKKLKEIETVAVDYTYTMGYGGSVNVKTYPVVLFKGGKACRDVGVLGSEKSIRDHERKHRKMWTKWRKHGGKYQLSVKNKWRDLPAKGYYKPLAPSTRIEGSFKNVTGSGNLMTGGEAAVFQEESFAFTKNGRFRQGKFVAGTNAGTGRTVTGYSKGKASRGSYYIDGYWITMNYDDGKKRVYSIVGDMDDDGMFWIEGSAFKRK